MQYYTIINAEIKLNASEMCMTSIIVASVDEHVNKPKRNGHHQRHSGLHSLRRSDHDVWKEVNRRVNSAVPRDEC